MRLIVHGQQAFGQAVLEKLIERGEEIVGVYVAPDKGKPDPLKVAAEEAGLPVFQPSSYKEPEVWSQMKTLKPDLCVMAFVTLFVPEEALYLPTHGTIQYHPSLLPLHRGPSAINWPIIMGRKETGLSIFWPDNGLDEGPILIQKTCSIEENDTLGTVYFDKLFPMGVDAMLEGVDLVKAGKVHAFAHITGGGLLENIPRVLPDGLTAHIDGKSWTIPNLFGWLALRGGIENQELARTFNLGIGMIAVVSADEEAAARAVLEAAGETVYRVGEIRPTQAGEPATIVSDIVL